MSWLRKALGLCQHKWEIIDEFEILRRSTDSQVGKLLVLRCQHCGDVKKKRIAP